jgi:uracil-DNA glycosylase family 4
VTDLTECRLCPRLVEWREEVAVAKRAAFRNETYWGRPVPAFGDPRSRLVVVGLAPAAHGANRTGRMFTGDRSGEWLYRSLHRFGFANQAASVRVGDGLRLDDALVTAAVRCAPPGNRPTPEELATCRRWLEPDLRRSGIEVIVALGSVAFAAVLRLAPSLQWQAPRPLSRFRHGEELSLSPGPVLLASYHPSQQNTFTGRLTEEMFDSVFARARALLPS